MITRGKSSGIVRIFKWEEPIIFREPFFIRKKKGQSIPKKQIILFYLLAILL